MKKRLLKTLITSIVVSSFIVTPVLATPSVEELEQGRNQAEAAAASVNSELVNLLVQFDALKKDIDNQQKKIDESAANLAAAEEKEKEQYRNMKLRIKYMYEAGDTTFLEALLTVSNYADLVNKAEYVQKVHSYDRKKLEEYIETKEEVASLKNDLESGQAEMQVMAKDYESQQAALESTLGEMRSQIADFDSQLAAAQAEASAQLGQLSAEAESVIASMGGGQNNGQNPSGSTGGGSNQQGGGADGGQGGQTPSGGNAGGGNSGGGNTGGGNTGGGNTGGGNSDSGNTGGASSGSSQSGSSSGSSNTSNSGKGQQIANTGCGYVGRLNYVLGGTSLVSGADCSGFTQSIFRQYGISIPRTAEAQWAGWGRTVSYAEALPGDLVCYSGHVGIYIGGGQLVHASNERDGVKISNIGYRQWLGFKRYW